MLEALIEREKEEREILTTRREKAQADAEWMKQVRDKMVICCILEMLLYKLNWSFHNLIFKYIVQCCIHLC